MGQSASNMKAAQAQQQSEPAVEGHWVSDIKTGYRWATDPIVSDSSIEKKPLGGVISGFENQHLDMLGMIPGYKSEIWGPYKKLFTKSSFGGQVFTPPESIDGIPILCRCRDIYKYMRDERGGVMLQGLGAVALGKQSPMCWDDKSSLSDFLGGMYFYVIKGHPEFYIHAMSKHGLLGVAGTLTGFGRGGTRKQKSLKKSKKSTRKHKYRKSFC